MKQSHRLTDLHSDTQGICLTICKCVLVALSDKMFWFKNHEFDELCGRYITQDQEQGKSEIK